MTKYKARPPFLCEFMNERDEQHVLRVRNTK